MKAQNFRDLQVWTLGKQIALAVYSATKSFPTDERYGLTALDHEGRMLRSLIKKL